MSDRTLNLGILAHVDAGKTTLTERLLYETGATRHLGRVDHGDTTTDADSIERRRGITIRTAVATMTLPSPRGPVKVNLIDTPGHSDFVAEVERALAVLDGAVLVVSAVEGVQAQTRVLIRILQRLGLPFLVFANKVDRVGASLERTLDALREELPHVVPLFGPVRIEDVVDAVSPWDDRLLREYVDGAGPPDERRTYATLAEQARLGRVHPALSGAALAGVGIAEVLAAITTYLPSVERDETRPLHATVFKIDRDADGHRVAYVRIHEGRLAPRDHVTRHRRLPTGAIATYDARALEVRAFERGAETLPGAAVSGDIATVLGLGEVAIGDQLGRWDDARSGRQFPAPGLESVVQPRDPAARIELFSALQQLSEQDPLIAARLDGVDEEITVDVYGEVQKEVLATRLADQYGVAADFLPTRTVHVERVAGTGEAGDRSSMGNAQLALRVEAAPVGTGLDYALGEGVERGYLLPSFHVAIEETLAAQLSEGLYGWRIADCRVRVVHSRFSAPTPSAGEYRKLTVTTFRRALALAGTTVCAPVSRFELGLPAESLTAVLSALVAAGATAEPVEVGTARCQVAGTMPTAAVAGLERRLPDLTSGRGFLTSEPAGYVPVRGTPPTRRRQPQGSVVVK
ncbi:MAG TPA: GTP-binding protein [Nocardioides bacterium]|uniref:elongation factor G n=1 Tax=uncultured Nocardioides sp. TaxID=198441 RepID=UPI000EBA45F2|nr:TetM/TetW/TetO/TetS family tetracycline resistance ribosomal protection protein [uncultured Nocardioides sp.]HCB07564.1 GTP-binding protein [Nocardioides sp.]